jgi:hypothetical protein
MLPSTSSWQSSRPAISTPLMSPGLPHIGSMRQ